MKKEYESPNIEIEGFEVEDIIAASGDWDEGNIDDPGTP